MLIPLAPLEAYLRDRPSASEGETWSAATWTDEKRNRAIGLTYEREAQWLRRAITLDESTRGMQRTGMETVHRILVDYDATVLPGETIFSTLTRTVLTDVTEIEEWVLLNLAHSTVVSMELLLPEDDMLERGRALYQRGRIARKLGEYETAWSYFDSYKPWASRRIFRNFSEEPGSGSGYYAK